MLRDGVTWSLFHRSNIPNMRWKATVIVRLLQYMSFIWSVSNNNFFYSNMSNFVPEKVILRGVLLHYFNMKKTAAESHRILVENYSEHALAERKMGKSHSFRWAILWIILLYMLYWRGFESLNCHVDIHVDNQVDLYYSPIQTEFSA